MYGRNETKLKRLEREVPEGLIVTSAFLGERGYSSSLRSQYVKTGWLEQPTRGVFRRLRGELRWEQVMISLQTLLEFPLVVGGRTALELQGYAHYLSREQREVHVHGRKPFPAWMKKMPLEQRFVFHESSGLFRDDPPTRGLASLNENVRTDRIIDADPTHEDSKKLPWGQWNWPLAVSAPERALLEMLDELPDRESFHLVDDLVEGLANLSPGRLQRVLERCHRIKVKRLFFFFADRHALPWLKHIDRGKVYLGKGERMLVRGGKFDPVHRITVPEDLRAV